MPKIKERVKINPFMESFGEAITIKSFKVSHRVHKNFINIDTGEEVNSYIDEPLRKSKDFRHFVKIMDEGLDVLMNLSPSSYKLYYWILKNLVMSKDTIIIYGTEVQVELGYKSINSIHRAIEGLVDANMIAPQWGSPWSFFINPNIFYKGDMVDTYIEYVTEAKLSAKGTPVRIRKGEPTLIPIEDDFLQAEDSDVLMFDPNETYTPVNINQYREGR